MSFRAYLPICLLDPSLSLNLLLFHMYFKFSSFCLCHTSPQSLSLFFVSQQKSLSSHLQNSLHTICQGWQAPVRSSLSSPGGSQSRKACGSPLKQLSANRTPPMVPSSLMSSSFTGREESLGVAVCLLGPGQSDRELGVGRTDSRVRWPGFSSRLHQLRDCA